MFRCIKLGVHWDGKLQLPVCIGPNRTPCCSGHDAAYTPGVARPRQAAFAGNGDLSTRLFGQIFVISICTKTQTIIFYRYEDNRIYRIVPSSGVNIYSAQLSVSPQQQRRSRAGFAIILSYTLFQRPYARKMKRCCANWASSDVDEFFYCHQMQGATDKSASGESGQLQHRHRSEGRVLGLAVTEEGA
ncbi:hypothetical protein SS50377_23891 [Spironucleus salmonicida]|nr:hypothetical protein SS50377_23879 [Spironucleus salmonicida]KAH0573956.1 hypothetical protein SS50377_23891 [Spironucleus salmonicida]|eukprot:EST48359.1 Hypothetical protein SS50377_11476 [Spironucleus salmonicida]